MPLLIDGHNLIGRLPQLSLQDPNDEEKLVRLLKSYQARTGKTITVVFDPGGAFALPRTFRLGGIEVVFASHRSSADAIIARRVRQSPDPHRWLVITSDHRLAATVARHGARVRSAEAFAAELDRPRDTSSAWKDIPLSAAEVEEWLALFEE